MQDISPFDDLQVLFSENDLDWLISHVRNNAKRKLSEITSHTAANRGAQISDYIKKRYELICPQLDMKNRHIVYQGDTKIPIRNDFGREHKQEASFLIIGIPYTGFKALFRYRPNRYRSFSPSAKVDDGVLNLQYIYTDEEPKIEKKLNSDIDNINFHLDVIRNQVKCWNDELNTLIENTIQSKIDKYHKNMNIIENLGFPIDERVANSMVSAVTLPTTQIDLQPIAEPKLFLGEERFRLSEENFNGIRLALAEMGRFLETNPDPLADYNEEQIRNLFLFALSSKFSATATGESLQRGGRTDIRLEMNNRGVFIAECKIWRGSEYLSEGYKQLLDYLTWRESRAVMMVFSRNKRFSQVLATVRTTMTEHPLFTRMLPDISSAEFQCKMRSTADDDEEITISTIAFNLAK